MTSRVVSVVTTSDGEHISRKPQEVLDKAGELLLANGWRDGYSVTLTVEVRSGELPEDTDWLERELGHEGL